METEKEKILIDALLSNADWINGVLFTGLSLCVIMIILKILGKGEKFEIFSIMIPTKYFWLVILAMTIAHFYCTILFVRNGAELFYYASDEVRQNAFFAVSKKGPLFFRGLIPRLKVNKGIVDMSLTDPTTLLAHGAAVVMFVATVRYKKVKWGIRIFSILIGLFMMISNWLIGTNWAVAASELSLENRNESFYYKSLRQE